MARIQNNKAAAPSLTVFVLVLAIGHLAVSSSSSFLAEVQENVMKSGRGLNKSCLEFGHTFLKLNSLFGVFWALATKVALDLQRRAAKFRRPWPTFLVVLAYFPSDIINYKGIKEIHDHCVWMYSVISTPLPPFSCQFSCRLPSPVTSCCCVKYASAPFLLSSWIAHQHYHFMPVGRSRTNNLFSSWAQELSVRVRSNASISTLKIP